MNHNMKRLSEGAMMCGLIGLILVINRQLLNALDVYLFWIIPLPLIVYTIRYGIKNACVVTVSSTLLAFMLSLPQTVFYVLASCIVGMVYGYGVRNKKSNGWLIGNTILGSCIIMIITAILFAELFGYDLTSEVEFVFQTMEQMKVPVSNQIRDMGRMLLYASMFISCVLEGFLVHIIAFVILRKLKIEVPQFVPIFQYKAPRWFGYFSVLVVISNGILPYFTQNTQLSEILLCITIICSMIAGLFGYILVLIAVRVRRQKYGLLFFFLLLLLFTKFVLILLVTLGLLDMTTDIRQTLIGRFAK
ncbi:MAG: DUF2232 domain-containing protein [Erysipelotrichaceae bacterium]|nr:DUF2232 domain-containing protein [Erysipelotrichaceae bacterium]